MTHARAEPRMRVYTHTHLISHYVCNSQATADTPEQINVGEGFVMQKIFAPVQVTMCAEVS